MGSGVPLQDADDLLQQTSLAYLYKHADVRDSEAWILGTLRHKCFRYWRRRKRTLIDPVGEEALAPVLQSSVAVVIDEELGHEDGRSETGTVRGRARASVAEPPFVCPVREIWSPTETRQ